MPSLAQRRGMGVKLGGLAMQRDLPPPKLGLEASGAQSPKLCGPASPKIFEASPKFPKAFASAQLEPDFKLTIQEVPKEAAVELPDAWAPSEGSGSNFSDSSEGEAQPPAETSFPSLVAARDSPGATAREASPAAGAQDASQAGAAGARDPPRGARDPPREAACASSQAGAAGGELCQEPQPAQSLDRSSWAALLSDLRALSDVVDGLSAAREAQADLLRRLRG